jgi:hypothetical protein
MVTGSQPIAMTDQHLFTIVFEDPGFVVDRDIQLLFKVAAHPHIVIAGKKMNGNTRIGDLRHLSQDTGIAFGHYRPVFIPEIEEVPYDKDFRGILPDLFEESDDVPFADQAGRMIGSAQMKIREEIDLFSGGDGAIAWRE